MRSMLPRNLALIDDDAEYSEYLAQHLRGKGIEVSVFDDSNTLLADAQSHRYDFYLVDLMLPGVDGVELIKVIRRRSDAGLLVVSGRLGPDVFASVMTAGADMYLAKPVQFDQVSLAIQAVQRRAGKDATSNRAWKLDREARELIVPDGARVGLSEADITVLECFLDDGDDGLNAIIYRLRRRIERATPMLVPLQSRSRVGYLFRAPLTPA
jgi:two-component system, OmpR family, response regulator